MGDTMSEGRIHTLRFAGTVDGLDSAVRSLRAILDARALSPRHRHDVELVFEEVASNIVNYGRPASDVEAVVQFGDETVLTFEDDGRAFDPRLQPPPAPVERPADLRIGGLGLVIVRDLCTRLDYVRTPEARNRLTLTLAASDRDPDATTEVPIAD
jgi:anti-sigma regulatory factor (Ser/Thr protein kinase)